MKIFASEFCSDIFTQNVFFFKQSNKTRSSISFSLVISRNSLLRVRKEDFNALDALDMDSEAVQNTKNKNRRAGEMVSDASYGQDVPAANHFEQRSGPPILPPHLLQVILNKVSGKCVKIVFSTKPGKLKKAKKIYLKYCFYSCCQF